MTMAISRARHLSRSVVVLPVVALLTVALLTADVSSSEAAGQRAAASCTLNVASRVAISSPYVNPTFSLGADCASAGVIDARWEAKRADGAVMKKAFFNFSYPTSWSVFDTTSLAPWTWQPAGARTRGDTTLATAGQNTPSTADTEQIQATVPQNTPHHRHPHDVESGAGGNKWGRKQKMHRCGLGSAVRGRAAWLDQLRRPNRFDSAAQPGHRRLVRARVLHHGQ
ncbi:hypothetical protein PWY87_17455 [Kribbella solani]|uniref:hypothetical protein n=1 Tax=Kribbella solani TaxID=236067 RepID=UPI0029B6E4EF|nr:hypothetical protein [Kribbella solani]MDX3003478.1 hypothetical protein [Kribbella solani]